MQLVYFSPTGNPSSKHKGKMSVPREPEEEKRPLTVLEKLQKRVKDTINGGEIGDRASFKQQCRALGMDNSAFWYFLIAQRNNLYLDFINGVLNGSITEGNLQESIQQAMPKLLIVRELQYLDEGYTGMQDKAGFEARAAARLETIFQEVPKLKGIKEETKKFVESQGGFAPESLLKRISALPEEIQLKFKGDMHQYALEIVSEVVKTAQANGTITHLEEKLIDDEHGQFAGIALKNKQFASDSAKLETFILLANAAHSKIMRLCTVCDAAGINYLHGFHAELVYLKSDAEAKLLEVKPPVWKS